MTSALPARLREAATVVAPATAVTALLFYFGYVAVRARLRHFGVYLDMVDLSLRETLLYGVEAIYPPLLVLAFAGLVATGAHAGARWLLSSPRRDLVTGWAGVFLAVLGAVAFVRGVTGFAAPDAFDDEPLAATPLGLGLGALGLGYGGWLLAAVGARRDPRPASPALRRLGRHLTGWGVLIVLAASFWTVNEFAAAYGRGRAEDDAAGLPARPEVLLYTAEPLAEVPCGVEHTRLSRDGDGAGPAADGGPRHRYAGLRLLVEAGDRLFLVPAHWDPARGRTLVIRYDADVRLELRPASAAPDPPACDGA